MLPNLQNSYSDSPSLSEEEDFINMEVVNDEHQEFEFPKLISCSSNDQEFEFPKLISSSSNDQEFEFPKPFSSSSKAAKTAAADELFYKGILPPLHVTPTPALISSFHAPPGEYYYGKPYATLTPTLTRSFHAPPGEYYYGKPTPNLTRSFHAPPGEYYKDDDDEAFGTFTPTSTPFGSSRWGSEVNPTEYNMAAFEKEEEEEEKEMKTRATKQPSTSSSSSRMKWISKSYIKSLFTKSSGRTEKHSAASDHSQLPKENNPSNKNCTSVEGQKRRHRRSLSELFKKLSSKPKSAPATSNNVNLVVFKRSSSATREIENPIQAAIAHCKRSQNSTRSLFSNE